MQFSSPPLCATTEKTNYCGIMLSSISPVTALYFQQCNKTVVRTGRALEDITGYYVCSVHYVEIEIYIILVHFIQIVFLSYFFMNTTNRVW